MKILRAREFGSDAPMKMSEIFVDGFFQWLRYFSNDKAKLTKAFRHIFNLDVFYVAVIDGEIAGITACADGKASSVQLKGKELRKHLGLIQGTIASFVLKRELEERPYPVKIEEGMGVVEFVATSPKYRGQGVATAIMNHIFDTTPYEVYILEVADTNPIAVKLYEKLGYVEFLRIKHKHSKQSGVNHFVYMKYSKTDNRS